MVEISSFIPYGRQCVEQDDVDAVSEILRSDWLTTGPKVAEFEEKIAGFCSAEYGVAVNSGTAALHSIMHALGIGPGDEVIVPALTFAATANAVVYQRGRPVFADVDAETLLISPDCVKQLITPKTKAVVAVDYAGHPCDYAALRSITDKYGLALVADSCHALGASHKGNLAGTLADMTAFSFHPVKHITTGEGGMVVTDNAEYVSRIKRFRNHGIATDHYSRQQEGTWLYNMVELGFNYRISDILCALGISQLKKLPSWLARRREIAVFYNHSFKDTAVVTPLKVRDYVEHAYHLYVVLLKDGNRREQAFREMRRAGIGVNVHYIPVHLHSFYRERFGTEPGVCPVAEKAYSRLLSLPMHQGLQDAAVARVCQVLLDVLR